MQKTVIANAVKQLWSDLETYSDVPIKCGAHRYSEGAEVFMWAFAVDDDAVYVWDIVNSRLYWQEPLSGEWESEALLEGTVPPLLLAALKNSEFEVWFQNGGMFDFVMLQNKMPEVLALVDQSRWRDTMIQAYSHALPGSLDKLGIALELPNDEKKDKRGKQLIQLFCKPQNDVFFEKYGTRRASVHTHPKEWMEMVEYAGGDIVTMRAVHKLIPKWNYRGKQIALWHADLRINNRGFMVDMQLAEAAVEAVEIAKKVLADRTKEITDDRVSSTNRRDMLLKYILAEYGVELPDLRADTLERRLEDPDLPDAVHELLRIRLVASMNSTSKYRTLMNSVCHDSRIRGGAQFRGAGRTGRYAHRMFQHGNMPRPTISQALIEAGIGVAKADLELLYLVLGDEIVQWASSAIRSCIVAPPGRLLAVADLANIEGRVAAWLAGEEWKLQAFRDYDSVIGKDAKGKDIRKGADLYILAYANSFNVPVESVPPKGDERQIGKVEELMFQYGGGVGAWLTGAATYGIDLDKMTDQVYPTLQPWAVEEAMNYLTYLNDQAKSWHAKTVTKLERQLAQGLEVLTSREALDEKLIEKLTKARMGLPYKTFVTCDAIKRMWRKAHPRISSYWKELEEGVREAVANPKRTIRCRKVLIRCSGSWLRIQLPSGRQLCYPSIEVSDTGVISYMGPNTYSRKWSRITTYGGKLFENCIAEGTEVLTEIGWQPIENVGNIKVWDGLDWVSHRGCVYQGNKHTIEVSGIRMTPNHRVLTTEGWTDASSCEGHYRVPGGVPDCNTLPRQRREEFVMGGGMRLRCDDRDRGDRVEKTSDARCRNVLRMSTQSDHRPPPHLTRNVVTPNVCGVACDARSVFAPFACSLVAVWRTGYQSLCRMAEVFRQILGRHGPNVPERVDAGAREQRKGVLPEQLRLGNPQSSSREYEIGSADRYATRENSGGRRCGLVWGETHDLTLEVTCGVASAESSRRVFDLMDCGPRHRFVVRNLNGDTMIVHNCVQAVACDQLVECFPIVEDAGFDIVFHVHDETATEVDEGSGLDHKLLAKLMCSELSWNEGLPLAAAGFTADRYKKD